MVTRTQVPRSWTVGLIFSTVLVVLLAENGVSGLHLQPNNKISANRDRMATALGYANEETVNAPTSMVGQILNDKYLIHMNIPVASAKCELYEAFHVDDVARQNPVIVKMSHHLENIAWEHANYMAVKQRLGAEEKRLLFVEIYDKIEASPKTKGMSALVMEKGEDNLRFHVGRGGPYRGEKLRKAMEAVIRIVDALHQSGLVWTEIKAENFVIQKDGGIKAIDLESVIGHNRLLRMYTAEACPPEFPVHDLYKCLPEIHVGRSFDMWGLGMTLFELATGKPFYAEGLTDLEYIKGMLANPPAMVAHMEKRLVGVNLQAANIVRRCLMINPLERSKCHELLEDPYFNKPQPNVDHVSSANFGAPAVVESKAEPEPVIEEEEEVIPPSEDQVPTQPLGTYYLKQALPTYFGMPTETGAQPLSLSSQGPADLSLRDLGLSARMEAILDAINVVAEHDPEIARNLLISLERAQNGVDPMGNTLEKLQKLEARLEAELDIINECAQYDPEVARKLLAILEEQNRY